MLPRNIYTITMVLLSLCMSSASAHGFFGSSGPDPSLEQTRSLVVELKERTGTLWNEIDKHVEILLSANDAFQNMTPEAVNALTEMDIINALDERQKWQKKLTDLKNFLAEEYKLYIENVKSSKISQEFKEGIVKHYDQAFRDETRKHMYPFLNGMENINQSLLETYKIISILRFPPKSSGKEPEVISESRLNIIKSAISPEVLNRIKAHRQAFLAFSEEFQFNPLEDSIPYQASQAMYEHDPKTREKLKKTFEETYLDDGAYKAEANMKFYLGNILAAELAGALPKASGKALEDFAVEDVTVLKNLALGSSGDDTKSCLVYAEATEFVGVDFTKITNEFFHQEAPWRISFFKAANSVLGTAKTAPEDFSAGRKQAEQLLELGKKSALIAIRKDRIYKKFMKKNKFSPRRYCFQRYKLLQELLKLPPAARQDTLRLIYLEDLEKKLKNMETAAQK